MQFKEIALVGAASITEEPLLLVGGISRSGTTLLTTVLDAHSQISMGAELIPTPMKTLEQLIRDFEKALEMANGDYIAAGKVWKHAGDRNIGLFFTRCHRAGITCDEFKEVMDEYSDKMHGEIKSLRDRLTLAWALMRRRWKREGTRLFGFKLNSPSITATSHLLPNAHFVCLVRDPVDVVCSQIKRKFASEPVDMAEVWATYAEQYSGYAKKHPDRCTLIRYEDLVRSPRRTLNRLFNKLPIDLDENVFSYHKSDAAIFNSNHPNLNRIRMNFSDSSVGSGHRELKRQQLDAIQRATGRQAATLGYNNRGLVIRDSASGFGSFLRRPDTQSLGSFNWRTVNYHRSRVRRASKFQPSDYESLLAPYLDDYNVMRLIDYVRLEEQGDDKVLLIRHDVDHDLDTAQQMAAWEASHGIRSTYCILHTAWYYGTLMDNGRYQHSRMLIDGIERLLELGHEINFHNNLVVVALREGLDPFEMLEQELAFFEDYGIPIAGSSQHGDALCRTLNFRNWELFTECCDDRFGGPRDVAYTGEDGSNYTVALGQRSMFEFGLEYEAYDIARDIYHTDSGGNMRTRENLPGRRDFGRKDGRGRVVGVLTHPIWWNF